MKICNLNYLLFVVILFLSSCATIIPQQYAKKYYQKNEFTITRIEENYKKIVVVKPIVLEFSDNEFNHINVEIKTDSIRYIYEFDLKKTDFCDTLQKFGYHTVAVVKLIKDMKLIKCTWINKLDYYLDDVKQSLIFMSMRPISIEVAFANRKYYILTFYKQPQYYDAEGKLLDKRNRVLLRKINNEIFWRINDRVCYTISNHFR